MHAEAGEPGGVNNPFAVSSASAGAGVASLRATLPRGLGSREASAPGPFSSCVCLVGGWCAGLLRGLCVQPVLTGKGPSLRSWAPGE